MAEKLIWLAAPFVVIAVAATVSSIRKSIKLKEALVVCGILALQGHCFRQLHCVQLIAVITFRQRFYRLSPTDYYWLYYVVFREKEILRSLIS